MSSTLNLFVILLIIFVGCDASNKKPITSSTESDAKGTILFLPLDERYITRDAFLNLAPLTPFNVVTPPTTLLPHQKQSPDQDDLLNWIKQNVQQSNYIIMSAEMMLYGGLIASRCTNDSFAAVKQRLDLLTLFKKQSPNLKIYLATVVMRIPSYNEDVEEPTFWATYGADIYQYSYYLDKYMTDGNQSDLDTSNRYKAMIPPPVLENWLWRRSRNHNITVEILNRQYQWIHQMNTPLFEQIFITQDDNAKYGLNIREANELRSLVKKLSLSSRVNIYPGADEVGFTMLGKLSSDVLQKSPTFNLIFRDPSTTNLIPNYEGQPVIDTIRDQIHAAGGTIKNTTDSDIYFLLNNFSTKTQIEAPNQPPRSITDFDPFNKYLGNQNKVYGLGDIRYSNGADLAFVNWIYYRHTSENDLHMENFAYAGWNTDGNTLGTVIGNSILLSLFKNNAKQNEYFNSLRILEDCNYQAGLRQELYNYVIRVNGDNPTNLGNDIAFYTRYVYKRMNSDYQNINKAFNLPFQLQNAYFPWNRTFEIGFNEPVSFN